LDHRNQGGFIAHPDEFGQTKPLLRTSALRLAPSPTQGENGRLNTVPNPVPIHGEKDPEETFMAESKESKFRGVATLFDHIELKKFFKFYILMIFILELLIFLFCFLCQLEPINIPFPWKYYFLSSFLVPVAITFLMGLFVTAFNVFIFGHSADLEPAGIGGNGDGGKKRTIDKVNASLHFLRQAPFMLSLLMLGVLVIILSQLDKILTLFGQIGGRAVDYTFIALGVLLAIGTIFGLIWLVMRYKLDKMRAQYEYKREIMAQLGMIITDDNTVISNTGQIIALPEAIAQAQTKKTDSHLLPGASAKQPPL
jgi:hypothetical protein